jgi:hypothetical protein
MKMSGEKLNKHMADIKQKSKLRDLKILNEELPRRIAEAKNALKESLPENQKSALQEKLSKLESLFSIYQARVGSGQ